MARIACACDAGSHHAPTQAPAPHAGCTKMARYKSTQAGHADRGAHARHRAAQPCQPAAASTVASSSSRGSGPGRCLGRLAQQAARMQGSTTPAVHVWRAMAEQQHCMLQASMLHACRRAHAAGKPHAACGAQQMPATVTIHAALLKTTGSNVPCTEQKMQPSCAALHRYDRHDCYDHHGCDQLPGCTKCTQQQCQGMARGQHAPRSMCAPVTAGCTRPDTRC
jgi:hypothetical protein